MTHFGFTGTRLGMTPQQKELVRFQFMVHSDSLVLHHGDCVGADAEAHEIFRSCHGGPLNQVHIHPPVEERLRAFCVSDVVHPQKTHFARNRNIVRAANIMIATPSNKVEQAEFKDQRGGTWYTVNYAIRQMRAINDLDLRAVLVVFPDGSHWSSY